MFFLLRRRMQQHSKRIVCIKDLRYPLLRRIICNNRMIGEQMEVHLRNLLSASSVCNQYKRALIYRGLPGNIPHSLPELCCIFAARLRCKNQQIRHCSFGCDNHMVFVARLRMAKRDDLLTAVHLSDRQSPTGVLKYHSHKSACKRTLGHSEQTLFQQFVLLSSAMPDRKRSIQKSADHLLQSADWFHPLLLRYSSMAAAAVLPAPMARMTVAAPVTASPPA